ncbi:MAG: nuclear transport factor 2 family protein [Acidimicrobiia bacterium]
MTAASERLSADDRLEIIDLLGRYSWAFDARDGDAYARTFTHDGVMQGPVTAIEGVEQLTGWARDYPASLARHTISNIVIEGGADHAISKSTLVVLAGVDDEIKPVLLGEYHDSLRKTPDGWRIAHRRLVIHKSSGS